MLTERKAQYYLGKLQDKIAKAELQTGQDIAEALNRLCVAVYKMHPTQLFRVLRGTYHNDIQEEKENAKTGMKFGIKSIDEKLSGFVKKQLVLLS